MKDDEKVERIRMSSTCRVCCDCGEYIFYGEECIKETVNGPRRWHHLGCWEESVKEQEDM